MSITWTLYERWKALRPELSLSAAAKELGVSHTAVTFWRDGRNASAAVLERLCTDLGEDFARVMAVAWSEGARDAKDKKALLRLAKRFRGAGMALALGALPLMAPNASYASLGAFPVYSLCELNVSLCFFGNQARGTRYIFWSERSPAGENYG